MSFEREVVIEKLVAGGDGLARGEGKVIFVRGALPGETLRIRVLESKKDFEKAEIVTVITASPHRIPLVCPVAERCGGCDLMHADAEGQARFKVDMARDAYRRLGGFDPEYLTIETGSPLGYRNRVQWHTDAQGRTGFQARRSHAVIPITECKVAHPALAPLFASKPNLSPRPGRYSAYGHQSYGTLELMRADQEPHGEVKVRVLDQEFVFGIETFFQSNLEMLERLIPYVMADLKGKLALDLYCGVGLFGRFLQKTFDSVIGLEENPVALDFAERNLAKPFRLIGGRLEEWAVKPELQDMKPDTVVFDPPREGLAPAAREWLVNLSATRMVYVSCDPVTQARDLKAFLAAGWRIKDMRLFDFYPQTHHLEAVAHLERL